MEGGLVTAQRGGVDVRVRTPNQPSEGGEARQDEGKTEVGNREWGPNAEEEQARPRSGSAGLGAEVFHNPLSTSRRAITAGRSN